jgi:hypothetical protein
MDQKLITIELSVWGESIFSTNGCSSTNFSCPENGSELKGEVKSTSLATGNWSISNKDFYHSDPQERLSSKNFRPS